ncbi:hypothetical protein ACFL3H_10040 [Gemmatimonadota bacterium]
MALDRRSDDRRSQERRDMDRRLGPAIPVSQAEPRSQEDVDQIRSQLEYEMRMVRETADYLSMHGKRVGEVDLDSFLESFMLHVTFLLDFFFPTAHYNSRGPNVNEITPEWADRETISESLNRIRNKADNLLGGMSYFRIELPTKKDLSTVCAELEALRTRFELLLSVNSQSIGEVPGADDQGMGQR